MKAVLHGKPAKQISVEKTVGNYSYNFPKKHRIHFLICLIIQS